MGIGVLARFPGCLRLESILLCVRNTAWKRGVTVVARFSRPQQRINISVVDKQERKKGEKRGVCVEEWANSVVPVKPLTDGLGVSLLEFYASGSKQIK